MNRFPAPLSALPVVAILGAAHLARRTGRSSAGSLSRQALLRLGALGAVALATGAWRFKRSATTSAGTSLATGVSCTLAPEQTAGPYYIPKEKIRKNIVEHRKGTPLKLRIAVVDASTCIPVKNAAVDIWHCDAGGIYSGFEAASTGTGPGGGGGPTDKDTFLRGVQFTDDRGNVEFATVYPGWYRGRTVHIHVKVHLNHDRTGHVVHTGQLFFSDALTARVFGTGVYKRRAAARDTFNSSDSVYQNGGKQSTLKIKRDGKGGYIGTITLGVHT